MLSYITIILFIIILFLDYQYKNKTFNLEKMHGEGGMSIGSRTSSPVLSGDSINPGEVSPTTPIEDEARKIQEGNIGITDVIRSVYEPPTKSNIEGYTEYRDSSYTTSNSMPPRNSVNTVQVGTPYYRKGFGNFGRIGKVPPSPVATTCYLDFGCAGNPYDVDGKNESVCKRCIPDPLKQKYAKDQTYVMGRAAGRVRQITGIF